MPLKKCDGLMEIYSYGEVMIQLEILIVVFAVVLTGMGILAGGLLMVRRVSQTMSKRITTMNDGQALSANLTTAFLVIVASRWACR
jgi:PiT family inorganic phosphate transporter